jgi:ABC-type Mn2+/Zn2+ transport system permease subunit
MIWSIIVGVIILGLLLAGPIDIARENREIKSTLLVFGIVIGAALAIGVPIYLVVRGVITL